MTLLYITTMLLAVYPRSIELDALPAIGEIVNLPDCKIEVASSAKPDITVIQAEMARAPFAVVAENNRYPYLDTPEGNLFFGHGIEISSKYARINKKQNPLRLAGGTKIVEFGNILLLIEGETFTVNTLLLPNKKSTKSTLEKSQVALEETFELTPVPIGFITPNEYMAYTGKKQQAYSTEIVHGGRFLARHDMDTTNDYHYLGLLAIGRELATLINEYHTPDKLKENDNIPRTGNYDLQNNFLGLLWNDFILGIKNAKIPVPNISNYTLYSKLSPLVTLDYCVEGDSNWKERYENYNKIASLACGSFRKRQGVSKLHSNARKLNELIDTNNADIQKRVENILNSSIV